MRAHRAQVAPLLHDVDVPGRFPPRWLVVLGDSAAAGYDLDDAEVAIARLVGRGLQEADGRATAVRSVAVDGARTVDVLTTQVEAAAGAEVVLIGAGVNDALRPGISHAEVAEVTHRLLVAVRPRAADDATVVLLTCPDLSAAPGLPHVLRPLVGARCRSVAAAQTAVAAMLDVPTVSAPRAWLGPEVFGRDGFHPGALGHARLAERVLELLASGPDPGDADADEPRHRSHGGRARAG
jgi:lysophospholipase L1-like esterase